MPVLNGEVNWHDNDAAQPPSHSAHASTSSPENDSAFEARSRLPSVTLTVPGKSEPMALQGHLRAAGSESRSPTAEPFPPMPHSPDRPMSSSSADLALDEFQSHMKICWEQSIEKNLGIADDYERVGVLIVKWTDELDDLHTQEEANQIQELFRNDFGFETEIQELDDLNEPSNELMHHISSFVRRYNSRTKRHLMIVYYTGHGWWDNSSGFLLAPSRFTGRKIRRSDRYEAEARWNDAERALLHATGDVLAIFDTCMASNLMKHSVESPHNYDKIFEYICASVMDRGTNAPGNPTKPSFTIDLIKVLKQLLAETHGRFSTHYICQELWRVRPWKYTPLPWNRLRADGHHIRLGRVREVSDAHASNRIADATEISHLALQFELAQPELSEVEINRLSMEIAKACKNLQFKVRRVDWRRLRRWKDPQARFRAAGHAVRHMSNVTRHLSIPASGREGGMYAPQSPAHSHRSRDSIDHQFSHADHSLKRKWSGSDDPGEPETLRMFIPGRLRNPSSASYDFGLDRGYEQFLRSAHTI